jgi:transposase
MDLDNHGRTFAVPTTNIKSGNVVHDERIVGELRERITPRWRNYVSADTGKLYYRIRRRKRCREFLNFLTTLRDRWPAGRLYVVLDNFSPHKHPTVREWAAGNDVELIFLPTYGSWLNWIESEFAALRYFALNGTDHRTHAEQNAAIAAYIRWHNNTAQPKVNFAASSPIRSWTSYPAKIA